MWYLRKCNHGIRTPKLYLKQKFLSAINELCFRNWTNSSRQVLFIYLLSQSCFSGFWFKKKTMGYYYILRVISISFRVSLVENYNCGKFKISQLSWFQMHNFANITSVWNQREKIGNLAVFQAHCSYTELFKSILTYWPVSCFVIFIASWDFIWRTKKSYCVFVKWKKNDTALNLVFLQILWPSFAEVAHLLDLVSSSYA